LLAGLTKASGSAVATPAGTLLSDCSAVAASKAHSAWSRIGSSGKKEEAAAAPDAQGEHGD